MSNFIQLIQELKSMSAQDSFDVYQMMMQMAKSTSGISEKMLSAVIEEAKLRQTEWISSGLLKHREID